jgi:hypothetical protein
MNGGFRRIFSHPACVTAEILPWVASDDNQRGDAQDSIFIDGESG